MVFLIGPGASQDIKAYMEKGDRLNLTWSSNGPDLGYQIQLEDGHSLSRVLEIGISAKGENRFSAYHGGIHSISFKNFSRQQVTLTTKATGAFEYFRPSPNILKAGLDD